MARTVQKPVVYLETSFVSYLTGRVSGNPQIALNQAAGFNVPVITTPCFMLESRQ